MSQLPLAFWSVSASDLLQHLRATPQGLTNQEAQRRLARARAHLLKPAKRTDTLTLLLAQFKSPIILILLFAAVLSFFLHDPADAMLPHAPLPHAVDFEPRSVNDNRTRVTLQERRDADAEPALAAIHRAVVGNRQPESHQLHD